MTRTIGPVTSTTAAAAAVTTIIFWGLALAGVEAPAEIQGAVTTLLVLIAGYLVPPREDSTSGKHVADELSE